MEEALVLLLFLMGVHIFFRFANEAARKSANEELRREILREYLRRKRVDELYGRDRDSEDR